MSARELRRAGSSTFGVGEARKPGKRPSLAASLPRTAKAREWGSSGRLTRIKEGIIPHASDAVIMAVHRISLVGALVILLLAILFLFLIGPLGLLILIVAAVLLWYAFGPGASRMNNR